MRISLLESGHAPALDDEVITPDFNLPGESSSTEGTSRHAAVSCLLSPHLGGFRISLDKELGSARRSPPTNQWAETGFARFPTSRYCNLSARFKPFAAEYAFADLYGNGSYL